MPDQAIETQACVVFDRRTGTVVHTHSFVPAEPGRHENADALVEAALQAVGDHADRQHLEAVVVPPSAFTPGASYRVAPESQAIELEQPDLGPADIERRGDDSGAEVESEAATVALGPRNLSHRGLAVTAPEIEQLVTGLSLADTSVTERALDDDAVSSRALAEADGGAPGQDTSAGTGVKTGHLADAAVIQPKLAAGAVSFDKLATKLVFNDEVPVTATAAVDVVFETVPFRDRAFYLVSVGFTFPVLAAPFPKVRWAQFAEGEQGDVQRNGVRIENLGEQSVRVCCVAFRLG